METSTLLRPAKTAVEKMFKLKPGETFLIARDAASPPKIAEAMSMAAEAVGAHVIVVTFPIWRRGETVSWPTMIRGDPFLTHNIGNKNVRYYPHINQEPRVSNYESPEVVLDMLRSFEVDAGFVIAAAGLPGSVKRTFGFSLHPNTRMVTFGWASEEKFHHCLSGDYDAMVDIGRKLEKALTGNHKIRVTTQLGTDLSFEHINGRQFIQEVYTGPCDTPGKHVNFVLGLGVGAPKEGTGNGVLVVDGPIYLCENPLPELLRLTIRDHKITEIKGGGVLGEALDREIKKANAPYAGACPAEWGIGINAGAEMGPDTEGEAVYGTAHFAIGRNDHIPGGTITAEMSKFHSDLMIWSPKIEVDGKVILEDGAFQL